MSNEDNLGFISHLTELRKRLINTLIFLICLFVICYFFSDYIYGFLVEPYAEAVKDDNINRRLIFTALQETFLTYLKVSFSIFLQSFYFNSNLEIHTGLYEHEKCDNTYLIMHNSFIDGMLVYYLIVPVAIKFLSFAT